ncbi:uncharacterized protein G2W53_039895 [Senna tora]|uniref:Uncharacterized protein n=1 Tax=Senna tora TaxID=362788 RepID=A0A834T1Z4_9FABA|nr:uncharacterized protein G2W53_039895 [Senna tora]
MEKNVNDTNDEETLVIYHDDNIASEIEGCKCSLLTKVILIKRIIEGPLENALQNMWNSLARDLDVNSKAMLHEYGCEYEYGDEGAGAQIDSTAFISTVLDY